MNKSTSINVLLAVLLVVALCGWYVSSRQGTVPATISITTPAATQAVVTPSSSNAPMTAIVKYTANGFTPDPVTIKQGGTVTFTSVDGSPMWVASNAHPTHLQYDGTSRTQHCPNTAGTAFDQCNKGATYSFTFQKVGMWNYHNHVNTDDGGTINVVQ